MPTFEILTGALDQHERQELAKQIGIAAADAGQPRDDVTVVFIDAHTVFVHGQKPIPAEQFARVEVTIGGLSDPQRRQLARTVCDLLCDAGVREDAMTFIIRDVTAPQVAAGRGHFPFWPDQTSQGSGVTEP